MPTAAIKTLGCKLNQYESEQIREQLARLGYTPIPFSSPADLYIINTCTVTSEADREARKLVRQARRRNPKAFIVLTGCYAEVAAEQLQAMPEVDLICGMADKHRLPELLPLPPASAPLSGPVPVEHFAAHTRSLVKIQEGCNSRCSYCIVPEARGPSRSVPFAEVYEQALALAHSGHPELVLIGTHLGQYGRDLQPSPTVGRGLVPRREAHDNTETAGYKPPPHSYGSEADPSQPLDVADLLLRLAAIPDVQRLRLGSMEPREVSPALIEMVRRGGRALGRPPIDGTGKLCRHLHIPLQSGGDSVLQRMNRPYTSAFYADVVERVHEAQPLAGLGADVIVGFPGETDEEFEATRALVDRLPVSYLHVFAYSPRQGTPAADMPDQIAPPVKAERSQILRELSTRKHQAFAEKMVGLTLETVLQTVVSEGWLQGVTDNYLTLSVQAGEGLLGRLVACEVEGVEEEVLVGRVVG